MDIDFKLSLKRSLNHWTKEIGGVSFKLKYPTIEQGLKIERMILELNELKEKLKSNLKKKKDKNVDNMHLVTEKMLELRRYEIRVWIEDWKGMKENGKEIECKLIKNELEEGLWWALVMDIPVLNTLYEEFQKELEFNQTDKKK